jgi:phage protein U
VWSLTNLTFNGLGLRGIEQNPETGSRWAQLARVGKKVMQFLGNGRYVVVVDGQVFTYDSGSVGSL